jgi:hypothetical protein
MVARVAIGGLGVLLLVVATLGTRLLRRTETGPLRRLLAIKAASRAAAGVSLIVAAIPLNYVFVILAAAVVIAEVAARRLAAVRRTPRGLM